MSVKISIVVPIYNTEEYIPKCIVSLLQQTIQNDIEFVFVNDCTPDNSMKILQNYVSKYQVASQCIVVEHQFNQGVSSARNTGIDNAHGEYIMFCDSDDWIESDMCEKMYAVALNESADIVWSDMYMGNKVFKQWNEQFISSINCIKALLTGQMHGSVCNKMFKRSLFIDNNIKFIDGYNMWEDVNVSIKLFSKANKLAYLPHALYHYEIRPGSNMSMNNHIRAIKQIAITEKDETYLIEKYGSTLFEQEYRQREYIAKYPLLFTYNKSDFQLWKSTFPNAYNGKLKNNISSKIIYILAQKIGLYPLLYVFLKFDLLIQKLKN